MKRYIALLRFTDHGIRNLKHSTERAHHFDAIAEKAGVTIEGQYWTTGRYDGVLIIRAEEENNALHLLADLSAGGNVRTETIQAFTDKEFESIVNA